MVREDIILMRKESKKLNEEIKDIHLKIKSSEFALHKRNAA